MRPNADALSLVSSKALAYGFAAYLCVAVLLVGSAHREVALAMCTVGLAASILFRSRLNSGWNGFSWLCVGGATWSAVSLVPLPRALHRLLAPRSAELVAGALTPFGLQGQNWAPLSLDTSATWLELAKWCSYAFIAAFAAYIARTRTLNAALGAVWGSAVMVALVSVAQAFMGSSALLGLYTPETATPDRFASALVNSNNLAGYTNLGAFCGVALLSSRRTFAPRSVLAVGVVCCIATTVLSGSRGGILTLVAGTLALAIMWTFELRQSRTSRHVRLRTGGLWLIAGVVVVGGTLGVLGSTDALWREVLADDISKLALIPRALSALTEHWKVGVGRGAFESISALYFDTQGAVVLRYFENFIISWLLEWGLIGGGAAICVLAWMLWPRRQKLAGYRPAQAAWVGIIVLLTHNLVDLGLEIFGVTSAAFALLGALEGSRLERSRGYRTPSSDGPYVPYAAAVAIALSGVALLGTWWTGPDVYSTRKELAKLLADAQKGALDPVVLERRLRDEMRRRPAEAYFPLLGTVAALHFNRDALPWAAAAIERAPRSGRAHFMVASALNQKGALSQAMMHLRLAVEHDPLLHQVVGKQAALWTQDVSLLRKAAPASPTGGRVLMSIAHNVSDEKAPITRRALMELAHQEAPLDGAVSNALANELLSDLERRTAPCVTSGEARCPVENSEVTAAQIRELIKQMGPTAECDNLRATAKLLALEGKTGQALSQLDACIDCASPLPCMLLRTKIAQRSKDVHVRTSAEKSYLALSCSTSEKCASAEHWIGGLAEQRGDFHSALKHHLAAAGRSSEATHWLAAARAALQAQLPADAERAYERAKSLGASDPAVAEAIANARRAELRKLLR